MRKILVLRGGALGDFIVTLPALALLRRAWPDARIELAGHPAAAALALSRGLLDAAHSQHEARWAALYGDAPLLAAPAPGRSEGGPSAFARWLAEFDLVLNYWPDPDGELRARFPLRAGQRFLTAPATPGMAPAAAHYCEPLRALGLETQNYFFHFGAESGAGLLVDRSLGEGGSPPYPIAIHPGSGAQRKNWPMERWLELLGSLPSPLLVILGEAELERWRALTSTRLIRGVTGQRVGVSTLHLAVDLPLAELAARLANCRLFIGHDSGVSHLAAACGVPCVLLFGPTDPAMWAPPAPHVRVLRRGAELTTISVAEVRREIAAAEAAAGSPVVTSGGT